MDGRINNLKTNFASLMTIRITVKNVFDTLQQRIDKLKNLYFEFINNNDNQMFIFGLDSFRFQSKLIDIEYEDMTRMFLAINNRMYCEYFKLYKIIVAYISMNITDKKILEVIKVSNFPTYKDLEPFKDYKFEIIQEIHENILILIGSIATNIETKEIELSEYQRKRKIGLNIDNFVTSFNYDIIMMRERGMLFLTYMEFFHQLHTKYMKRFSSKIQLMYSHIDKDIDFSDTIDIHKDKKDTISEFSDETSELSDDLFDSIEVETNSETAFSPRREPELHRAFNIIESRCKRILTPMNEVENVIFKPLNNKVVIQNSNEIELDDNKVVITKLDETKSDDNKIVITKLDETKSDDNKIVITKSDETKSDETKSDDNKVVTTKLDETKSDETKSDDNKVVITKSDVTKLDETKSDDNKVVITKSDVTKLDETKSDDNKVVTTKLDETKSDDNETKLDETKLDDNKVVTTKLDETKSDDNETKLDETKSHDNTVIIMKLDETKLDETKTHDNTVIIKKLDEIKLDEIKSDDNTVIIKKLDETKLDETKTDETKTDETDQVVKKSDDDNKRVLTEPDVKDPDETKHDDNNSTTINNPDDN